MTELTINQVEDFCKALRPNSGAHAYIAGYVIRVEERIDCRSHIGKTIFVYPGQDTLDNALKDVLAIIKDRGIQIVKH